MAYDEQLADRVRAQLDEREDLGEQKMFGGLAFLIGGRMAIAVVGAGGLMVRCDPAETEDHIVNGAEPMIMRGKPMAGWLRVPATEPADDELARWVAVGTTYAESLPPKSG